MLKIIIEINITRNSCREGGKREWGRNLIDPLSLCTCPLSFGLIHVFCDYRSRGHGGRGLSPMHGEVTSQNKQGIQDTLVRPLKSIQLNMCPAPSYSLHLGLGHPYHKKSIILMRHARPSVRRGSLSHSNAHTPEISCCFPVSFLAILIPVCIYLCMANA